MTRVLVIDDDPATLRVLCELLADEGFATLTAQNGQEALEILWKSEEPLVALLDYVMPLMTGVDTLRYLAEDPERAHRHAIVLMSAHQEYPRLAAEVFPFELVLDAVSHAHERLCRDGAARATCITHTSHASS